jgi:antirestriction protein ArdC
MSTLIYTHVNASTGKVLSEQANSVEPLDSAMSAASYADPQWATFQQWKKLNRRVMKGEKGTQLEGTNGFTWYVFNVAQTKVKAPRE